MKPLYSILFTVVILFWVMPQVSAQTNDTLLIDTTTLVSTEDSKEGATNSSSKAGKTTPSYYRHHKKLSAIYNGHAIEITRSELPLKRSNPLLRQFGNIHYEKLKGGGYAYVLLVKFSTKKALKNYVKQVVVPNAPDAKAIIYRNGVRKSFFWNE